ncbi:MAG: 3-keto-5-aminohexanoate cleavage protein [Proteobacteria bacterium]|nr:3-keto-5-aminohexanoate cleavage protein [Pseudomonadota bacterium]
MNENTKVMIAVAPNGARKTPQDHPALPITAAELATTASRCLEAGACMIHLHVRDRLLRHTLDPAHYKEAIAAIEDAVGDKLIVQITTEAVGLYRPEEQMQIVREVKPAAVSLALRELCPTEQEEIQAAEFFQWLDRERVAPQYILYDRDDIARFENFKQRGLIPGEHHTILLVLGRYSTDQQSDPEQLAPLLNAIETANTWWLCAFGATESACMARAISEGGHCRVGFENNLLLPDGSTAADNAALVGLVAESACAAGKELATAEQARKIMGYRE